MVTHHITVAIPAQKSRQELQGNLDWWQRHPQFDATRRSQERQRRLAEDIAAVEDDPAEYGYPKPREDIHN